jgi:hypothetical protein
MERRGVSPNQPGWDGEDRVVSDWAIELTPGPTTELEREIANTKDPHLKRVLLDKQAENRKMAEAVGPVEGLAPQPDAKMIPHNFGGFTHYFPADASDAEIAEALDAWERDRSAAPTSNAPAASQGDVRRSEQPMSPLQKQEMDERVFDKARADWLKKNGGLVIRPADEERKLVSKATGLQDPTETRLQAETDEMVETGEYVGSNTTEYEVAKLVAGIGGYAVGGPFGATGAEALVRLITVNANLERAVKNGMDPEVADQIRRKELMNGVGLDAAVNFGLPILGQLIGKVPGVKRLSKFISDQAAKVVKMPGAASTQADDAAAKAKELLDIKRTGRAAIPDDPISQRAATELQQKMGSDFVLTPGQARGETGAFEGVLSKTFPHPFKQQEEAAKAGADKMLREATNPEAQMGREDIGRTILDVADRTEKAVKERLGPVFERAKELGVAVDMRMTRQAASKALIESRRVPGGGLDPREVEMLENIFEDLRLKSQVDPEYALKFISRRKEELRNTTADWKPSQDFETIVNKLVATAEHAYQKAAQFADPAVGKDLLRARRDYGHMMSTIYEDSIKRALRLDPEKVGDLLWQPGNTSRVRQLRHLLFLAEKEGALGSAGKEKIRQDVTRGFLQKGVRDIESAAKWSETLKKNPEMRDTWNALTHGNIGRELDTTMKVVEKAAQMALHRDSSNAMLGSIAVGRAANLGFGISYVTGTINGPMAALGLTIAGIMKMATTAYTRGDRGTLNLLNKVVRMTGAAGAGTGASAKALEKFLPELSEKAKEYGINPFYSRETEDEGEPE